MSHFLSVKVVDNSLKFSCNNFTITLNPVEEFCSPQLIDYLPDTRIEKISEKYNELAEACVNENSKICVNCVDTCREIKLNFYDENLLHELYEEIIQDKDYIEICFKFFIDLYSKICYKNYCKSCAESYIKVYAEVIKKTCAKVYIENYAKAYNKACILKCQRTCSENELRGDYSKNNIETCVQNCYAEIKSSENAQNLIYTKSFIINYIDNCAEACSNICFKTAVHMIPNITTHVSGNVSIKISQDIITFTIKNKVSGEDCIIYISSYLCRRAFLKASDLVYTVLYSKYL